MPRAELLIGDCSHSIKNQLVSEHRSSYLHGSDVLLASKVKVVS